MKKFHKTHPVLLGSSMRTSVVLVGSGGTGTHMLEGLAMMHKSLVDLGHNGLTVSVYDNDIVEEHNIGRQHFGWGDIGRNKANMAIERINRQYGLDWRSSPHHYQFNKASSHNGNILITATDSGKSRNLAQQMFKYAMSHQKKKPTNQEHEDLMRTLYWLDLGNDARIGQFVLAAHDLPTAVDLFGQYSEVDEGPSCSAAESLRRQDLFINKTLATLACHMLWLLFRRGKLDYHGGFVNLETMKMRPIQIPQPNDPSN
jgi:PRTRC genetic system ThiF family protein